MHKQDQGTTLLKFFRGDAYLWYCRFTNTFVQIEKESEPETTESTVDSTPDTLIESTSGTAELEMVQATEDLDSDDDLESLEE